VWRSLTRSRLWIGPGWAKTGRGLFKATVAASERYNARVEDKLTAHLGVRFEARAATDGSKRPVREVVSVVGT